MRRFPPVGLLALLCCPAPAAAADAPPDVPHLERVRSVVREIDRSYPGPVDARALVERGVEAIGREAPAAGETFGRCMGTPSSARKVEPETAVGAIGKALGCAGQPAERSDALVDQALRAMVGGLDSGSKYLGPEEVAALRAWPETGVTGLVVEKREGGFHVVSTRPASPARAAGLAGGEALLAINGAPIAERSFDEVDEMLKGPVGSPVRLTLRDAPGRAREVELSRVRLDGLADVEAYLSGDILVIALYTLAPALEYYVRQAVLKVESGPIRAVLLDLRSNRGGRFDQAWAIPDAYLDQGILVTTRLSRKRKRHYRAREGREMPDGPLVILVNQDTASGAEVVAAALQDNKRATVVGRTTVGAGSVQTLIMLGRERALRLTTAYVDRPDGRALAEAPVVPDCPTDALGEAALRRALALAAGDPANCPADPAPLP